MAKQSIQTNLLGKEVRICLDATIPSSGGLKHEAAGRYGQIVNVYYDTDGDLKYTIRINNSGELHEFYPHSFLT